MDNYLETPVTGQKWRRSFFVGIDNPLKGDKGIVFHAEDCVSLSDGEVLSDRKGLTYREPFTEANALESFPLGKHPLTGDDLGTANYMMVYIILSALFDYVAKKQDAPVIDDEE